MGLSHKKLSFKANFTDVLWMKALFLFSLSLALAPPPSLAEDETCPGVKAVEKTIDAKEKQKEKLNQNNTLDPSLKEASTQQLDKEIAALQMRRIKAESRCEEEASKLVADQAKCEADRRKNPDLFEWDPKTKTCKDRSASKKQNPNSGECDDAELFRGTNLKGEACKNTSVTIRDVRAQQEGLGATTQAAASAYTGIQAMQANGQQNDSQERQQKIYQALALSKIATGGLSLAGAGQLKSAASQAESASSTISESQKLLYAKCEETRGNLSMEQCFYQRAADFNVTGPARDYASFERMRSAANQSKEQADLANQMAKSSMISGLADTLTGLQALKLSRDAKKNAQVMAPLPSYQFGGSSQGGMSPGTVAGDTNGLPDYGLPGENNPSLGEVGGGPIGNSIKGGKGYGSSGGSRPERSSVSMASGGGGGGGGGPRGSGGQNNSRPRTNTTAGEYALGGGGMRGSPGSGGEGKNDGSNAFADALAKLFPQDSAGKPIVDGRSLASSGETEGEDYFTASEVYASDPSIFEQVTARYRQLAYNGHL